MEVCRLFRLRLEYLLRYIWPPGGGFQLFTRERRASPIYAVHSGLFEVLWGTTYLIQY